MSFRKHAHMTESQVPWLGIVPKHWKIFRLRRLVEIQKHIAGEVGYDVFSVTQHGFRIKDIESGEGQQSLDYSKYQFVRVGQFAMNPMDLLTGGVDIASTIGVTSPDYRVFKIRDDTVVYDRFLLYMLQMVYRKHIFYAYGQGSSQLGRWRLPRQQFNAFQIPIPPPDEQRTIAAFLDAETSKIDGLVSEQRRLIELLKEKRQAVISHAVTKGLNPDVKMKPSGIEWLGDVPEHWTTPPLYTRYEQVLGKMLDQNKLTGEHPMPYVRNVDVQWDRVNADELPVIDIKPNELGRFTIRNGDLLICEGGELGRTAIWNGDDNTVAFQKAIHRLRPLNATECPRYFYYIMRFANGMSVFLANSNPNTIPHLTGEQLRGYRFPKPPSDEQIEIAKFLDTKTGDYDSLVAQAERAIELLQERRTALISAAVTGKIDVRGYKHEDSVK